jgi:hypothetical protein
MLDIRLLTFGMEGGSADIAFATTKNDQKFTSP